MAANPNDTDHVSVDKLAVLASAMPPSDEVIASFRELLALCDQMRVFPPAGSDQEREEWPTLVRARAALAKVQA